VLLLNMPESPALGRPITLKLSGKVIPNHLYRSALSEFLGTFDKDNLDASGEPLLEYTTFHQGKHRDTLTPVLVMERGLNH
jgi:hypothetical protein